MAKFELFYSNRGKQAFLRRSLQCFKNPNKVIPNTGRIRDEKEIKGYYITLDYIEKLIKEKATNFGFLHYDGEGRKRRYFLSEKYENILQEL